jgi:hypothetical protein
VFCSHYRGKQKDLQKGFAGVAQAIIPQVFAPFGESSLLNRKFFSVLTCGGSTVSVRYFVSDWAGV